MKIFVVISAFNEEKYIFKVVKETLKYKLPLVVVDDGSKDGTRRVLKGLNNRKNFYILSHKVNLGKGAAIKTGAEFAFSKGAEAVIFMDADGQHNPSDLPKFIEKLKDYDVVLGSRNYKMGVPIIRFLGNKFASVLITFLFGIFVTDLLCGFRGIKKDAFAKMALESSDYAIETEMIIKIKRKNLKYTEIPVETVYKDNVKGVTILDAVNIFFEVIRWRLAK